MYKLTEITDLTRRSFRNVGLNTIFTKTGSFVLILNQKYEKNNQGFQARYQPRQL